MHDLVVRCFKNMKPIFIRNKAGLYQYGVPTDSQPYHIDILLSPIQNIHYAPNNPAKRLKIHRLQK